MDLVRGSWLVVRGSWFVVRFLSCHFHNKSSWFTFHNTFIINLRERARTHAPPLHLHHANRQARFITPATSYLSPAPQLDHVFSRARYAEIAYTFLWWRTGTLATALNLHIEVRYNYEETIAEHGAIMSRAPPQPSSKFDTPRSLSVDLSSPPRPCQLPSPLHLTPANYHHRGIRPRRSGAATRAPPMLGIVSSVLTRRRSAIRCSTSLQARTTKTGMAARYS